MSSTRATDRYREVHAHMARGNREAALAVVTRLQRENPDDAVAHFLRGRIALETGAVGLAKSSFERAVALDPAQADHHAYLGFSHAWLGERAEAARAAESALALAPGDHTLFLVARTWDHLGDHRAAAAALQRAATEGSQIPAIHIRLGIQLKYCGDFAAARCALERAIALDPHNVKARSVLSSLRYATRDDNQIAEFEALLARVGEPTQRLYIAHALASEYDALGEHERAFRALEAGKATVRARLGCDISGDQALFDAMRLAFDRYRPVQGYTDAQPIFVVGMPRSGTTVVERMLSLHPEVRSVGETLHMSALLQELAGRQSVHQRVGHRSAHLLDPGDVPDLASRTDLTGVGRAFMERLPAGDRPRVVDKFPFNSVLTGFILTALPNARVVCVMRGAMDTIVGNYRQLLDFESPIYRYTLSIQSCARYYVGLRRLVDLWSWRFPDRFRVIRYEELVADPERVSRAMLDFCGLSWLPGVTKIETNPAPVTTASAVQVRGPLHARRVGSWRSYERFVESALSVLAETGIEP